MRLTALAAQKFAISRRAAKEALKEGRIKVDGKIVKKDIDAHASSLIDYECLKTEISLDIKDFLIFQNQDACFIYKPPFMHSERLRPEDPISVSDIWAALPEYAPLSRLDYEADGVAGAIRKNLLLTFLEKRYLAIVEGNFPDKIVLDNKIDAYKTKKVKVLEYSGGYAAVMEKLAYDGNLSLISVTLSKAARHQVRAFCAYSGHAILGDKLYGGKDFSRLCLHCESYRINEYLALSGNYALKFTDLIDFSKKL